MLAAAQTHVVGEQAPDDELETAQAWAAGLTALQPPLAVSRYSPPGALGGGVVSTPPGGFGSVTYSQAKFAAGVAALTGPWAHGAVTGAPCICPVTAVRTSALVGSEFEARTATRAPSRAAWLMVS